MNRYEKLGRAVAVFVMSFMVCFAFAATCMIFLNFFMPYKPLESLLVCTGVGAFFGLFGGIIGYNSEF